MNKPLTYRYFFLSFAAAFFILSLLFLFLMITVHPSSAQDGGYTDAPDAAEVYHYSPSAEDSVTVLFIGYQAGASQAGSYILVRLNPAGGSIPIVVFPPQTVVENMGKRESISQVYAYGGAEYVRTALSKTLGIPIDRYVRLDTGAFITCANVIGAVEFELPQDMPLEGSGGNFVLHRGKQLLDGQKVMDIITYAQFEGGEPARCHMAGDLVAAIVNQRIDLVQSTLVDKVFERIINIIDTDISRFDYDNRKDAALYLAEQAKNPAQSLPVSGRFHSDETEFVLSDTFIVLVARAFL